MKNKYEVVPQAATTKKPAKAEITDAEFRRRLKNISEWRKRRLASFTTKVRYEVYATPKALIQRMAVVLWRFRNQ